MLPRSHPDYQPDGYHAGAIWPLYSGWVCLAEYRAGRVESAERHWHQIMGLYRDYALGAWPEVLHGEQGRRIGVTPDQAWSTLMVLAPWIAGRQTTEDVLRRS
jgi:glycogen debranching enzyme